MSNVVTKHANNCNLLIQVEILNWISEVKPLLAHDVSYCQEHPTSCSEKKLFQSGYSAGKIDPVLCLAGKVNYVCWEIFLENFCIIASKRQNFF